jgi:death-on-curing protein
MRYLTLEELEFIHDRIIEETGGMPGVRDSELLDSIVARQYAGFGGVELFPDAHAKAGAVFHGLATHQAFFDGNTRTGVAAGGTILAMNGYDLTASQDEVFRVGHQLAADTRSMLVEDVIDWLRENSAPRL